MARRLGCSDDAFLGAYWTHRHAYDAGVPADAYWRRVLAELGAELRPGLVDWLVAQDAESWLTERTAVWDVAEAFRRAGGRTALLSNGVSDIVRSIRARWPLEQRFDVVVISCEVGVAKPDPGIYELCVSRLGTPAAETLFVDDRLENVEGAERMGLQTLHFTGDADLARLRAACGL
jgi:putative hydrolase of the HAD superfamily